MRSTVAKAELASLASNTDAVQLCGVEFDGSLLECGHLKHYSSDFLENPKNLAEVLQDRFAVHTFVRL